MSASIEFNRSFKIVAVHDDEHGRWLEPLEYDIRWEMVSIADRNTTNQELERVQNQDLNKLIFFINEYLDNCIWCTAESITDVLMFVDAGEKNTLLITPQINGGQMCCALFSKFNSIVDDLIHVETVKLFDKQNHFSYNYSSYDKQISELPHSTDWIQGHILHNTPWWMRGDCSTGEIVAESAEHLEKISQEKSMIDKMLISSFEEINDMFREPREHSAEVIDINRAAEKKCNPETV